MELMGYSVCAGLNKDVAKRQHYSTVGQCIEAVRAASNPGGIWMAPVTRFGVGRWIQVARYDGRGRVFVGMDDEEATEEALIKLANFMLL